MDLVGVAPQDDPEPLLLLLRLSHIQSIFPAKVAYIYLLGRGEIARVTRLLSLAEIEEGYRASRMVRGRGGRLADVCSGWESDMLQTY